ncbi:hypothetical protein [Rheinheimera sp.]|uniref:hypothetical protein n=1 Tax=Rheinheimera sp. TaxID=1869214 RepID=UPI0040477976
MNRLTPDLNNLLRAKIEEQYQQFSKNLAPSPDYQLDIFDEWFLYGADMFKARVLAVIDSLTFDETDGGSA